MFRSVFAAGAALLLGTALVACNESVNTASAPTSPPEELRSIVELAVGNSELETLVTALTEAELVDRLSGPGPFTVFAPTNAAFEGLPEEALAAALADPDGLLTDILVLHVAPGTFRAADLSGLSSLTTLGGAITIAPTTLPAGPTLLINDQANVIVADIEASNGIIHIIDAVLEPDS